MTNMISQPAFFPAPGQAVPFTAWSQPLALPESIPNTQPTVSFADLLSQSLDATNGQQQQMHSQIAGSLTGSDLSMVETFSAAREADLALKLTLQIRNKLIEAYREIQNMQL